MTDGGVSCRRVDALRHETPPSVIPNSILFRSGRGGAIELDDVVTLAVVANLLLDLQGNLGILLEKLASVLAPLAEAGFAKAEEGTTLSNDAQGDAHVQQPTFLRDAFGEEDV